ncbi:molecular chaperone [Burkholderia pseudomallei]|uniref:fimbrial biogenesis chaperone n=1 Tax=Burkholderia pseudomallei TaxID=28450 RepID=UPI000A19FD11|nr:fimbria/pilus periplasmic chaperone [Burkholderia pseudomallei]ARL38887.1 pilus assembly protein [Burkholderia pseudomallei]
MKKTRYRYGVVWIAALLMCCTSAHASVLLSGTRVVFRGADEEATVRLSNEGSTPVLVQTWIDTGDVTKSPDLIDVPFVITPSIFRLEAGQGQTLRIFNGGERLPDDRESLFWLNVLEVPPKPAADDERNRIQLAIRTRIKLMYRPEKLSGSAEEAPGKMTWTISNDGTQDAVLTATNPTPYVVNLAGIVLNVSGKTFDAGMGYVLPRETARFTVNGMKDGRHGAGTVDYVAVDDWGGNRAGSAAIVPAR